MPAAKAEVLIAIDQYADDALSATDLNLAEAFTSGDNAFDGPSWAVQDILPEQPTLEEEAATADLDALPPRFDPLGAYRRGINGFSLLSAEEEVELSKRIEAGLYAATLLRVVNAKGEARENVSEDLRSPKENERPPKQPRESGVHHIERRVAQIEELPKAEQQELLSDLELVTREGELAKDSLIKANLRLVSLSASYSTGENLELADLISEGNLGLIRAVEQFDYTRGFKFSTYATPTIRHTISNALADQARTIRIPVHHAEDINRMIRVQDELRQELGRHATDPELAAELGITVKKLCKWRDDDRRSDVVSLDSPVSDETDPSLRYRKAQDTVDPTKVVDLELMKRDLDRALGTLSLLEVYIIRTHHGMVDGNQYPFEEIGQKIFYSRERARQIYHEWVGKLRHPSRAQIVQDYYLDN